MDMATKRDDSARDSAKTLLFVDDEPGILELMRLIMTETMPNVEVLTAPSGVVAFDLVQQKQVDAVISDFRMPLMDGITFLAKVRDHDPAIRRVLYTAYSEPELARRAEREAGVEAVYSKRDLTMPDMLDRVQTLLFRPRVPGAN